MKGSQKPGKVRKEPEKKWGIGDLGDDNAELFKHLPDPQEYFKETGKTKRKVKKDKG